MHDFSGWSGLVVLQPKQGNITRNLFSKIIRAIKKRFLYCLLTMIRNGWVRKTKKKWRRTLTIYPARKNCEKRYKREDVTTSVLNQKKLPGTSAKIWTWQSGETFKTFKYIGNVRNVGNVPDVSNVFNVHFIYICRYFADKQFFLIVNTFIYWIFNVMFNPVHHHCHPFTNFYKRFICVELKPFFTARKSDTPILWRVCLLVVLAGFNPRTYSIGTLHPVIFFIFIVNIFPVDQFQIRNFKPSAPINKKFHQKFFSQSTPFAPLIPVVYCYDLGLTRRFAGNVCQNLSLAVWGNVKNVQTYWERWERWQRSRRVRRSQTFLTFHLIYIYRYLANKQFFF